MDDIGFYNKYLLLNNSYLVKHIVWSIVKKNKESKNLNKIIDRELENVKKKSFDKETNTELISKCNKTTNTEIKRTKFLNNENGSLFNRLKNYKN